MTLVAAKNEPKLYGASGELLVKKEFPELDPTFFKSFNQLFGTQSQSDKIAAAPYELYSWVYACVNILTRNIKTLTPILWEKNSPDKIIREHEVLDLLMNPNPMMNQQDFFETIILNLSLPTASTPGGQCFIFPTDMEGNPIDLVRGIIPDLLWPVSDSNVEAVVKSNKFIGWKYKPIDSHPGIFFLPSQVIRVHNINRGNMLLGLSPYSALRLSVSTDAKSRELSDKFFANNASIGNILSSPKRTLNKNQVDEIKTQIREKFSGPDKAGNLLALHSGMELQQLETKNLSELEFTDQKKFTLDEIIACYGVNKMELGMIEDVNRSTAEVMKELLWHDTLIPLIDKIWDGGLNPDWIRYVGSRNLKGGFDLTGVSALRRNTEGKIKSARLLIADGMPPNLAWITVGLKTNTADLTYLDIPYVKGPRTNLETGEVIGIPAPEPEPAEPEKTVKKEVNTDIDEKAREKYWWGYVKATLLKPEDKYKRMVSKFWVGQRNRFLDQVDEWAKSESKDIITKAVVSDFMIPKEPEDKLLISLSEPVYIDGIKAQTLQMTSELGALTQWDPTASVQKRIINSRTKFLRGINSTTFKTMGKEIGIVLKENPDATTRELAKLIKKTEAETMNGIIASNSKTVARTETASIATRTRQDIMVAEGVKKHEWITARDESVREQHVADDGQIVKVGDRFPNTGLAYPLEAGGAPGNVINCRCVTVAVK